jgi:HAD superfamily hydrolase (TIGR01509 family)
VQAFLFDLDGLLIDSEPLWKRAESVVLARLGRSFDHQIAVAHMGMRMSECAAGMVAAYGLEDCTPERFATDLVEALLAEFDDGLAAMPGAHEAIRSAADRGVLAIASGSPLRVIERALDHFGWAPHFRVLCSADDVPRGKPAPDVFLEAARRLEVEPARCTVLEDSLNGARAARAAGMRCVAVPGADFDGAQFEGYADLVLESLEQFNPGAARES